MSIVDFHSRDEKLLIESYLTKGYIILDVKNLNSLNILRETLINLISANLNTNIKDANKLLDGFHKNNSISDLNIFRMNLINEINKEPEFRFHYYQVFKDGLDLIVGNELVMQKQVNLSIQIPNDESSLLDIHADTWSGDSPYEVVGWLPFVNCRESKSMFILPPKYAQDLDQNFEEIKSNPSLSLYSLIESKLDWININYGQILIFNQCLPHGNIVNKIDETRWTMNCRFKNIFSPYSEKDLGGFFHPITLKPASTIGMNYKLPNT